jgi:GH24 family phage-related lysozyme (muramidase)
MYTNADAIAWFKTWEGDYSHMYLDTRSVVTVGVGKALFKDSDATALPFVIRIESGGRFCAVGRAATAAEITTDFNEVTKQTPGLLAGTYKKYTKCDLPQSSIDELLLKTIQDFDARLRARLTDFASYPDPAQLGLLEMIYNLGEKGLFTKFPTFITYVQAQDWTKASNECKRSGPSKERNDATKALFTKAADIRHLSEAWLPNSVWNLWPFGPMPLP